MSAETNKDPAAGAPPEPTTHPDHHFEEGEEAPPPGVHTMAVVRWILLAIVIAAAFLSFYTYAAPLFGQGAASSQKAMTYFCPMHPQITSDHPGECPICHMSLEPRPEPQAAPSAPSAKPAVSPPSSSAASSAAWRQVNAAPTKADEKATAASPAAPPDTTPITLSLDRVQAIGVRTALVERMNASEALRVTAAVEVPEQGRVEVHTRAPGYVEAIHVRDTGVKVKAGEVLVSIFSPEVFQAEQELVTIGAWASPGSSDPKPLLAAARRKLELLGVGKDTIDRVAATGHPIRAVGITSPISGYVIQKNAVLGSYVMPDKTLFEIADLGRVYVIASVYPYQLGNVHVGDAATFTTPSLPGRTFETKADLIYPDVDLSTRTTRVRFQIKDKELRPGQFGTIELRGKPADVLTIPMDAVIDTGRSVYVFLAEDGGRFVARSVQLGEQIGGRFVVRGGLTEGERVVSGATFLIDTESRLQASLVASAPPPSGAPSGSAGPPPSRCDTDIDRAKFPDKWQQCRQCEVIHHGMGTMEQDCKDAIPKPWR
jgi:Cu(I)/Ag(I) efflux system membrane fusion protein